MPEHASLLLLLFILMSCFYKKHIQSWKHFKWGLIAYVTGIGIELLSPWLGSGWGSTGYVLLTTFQQATLIASGALLVFACYARGKLDTTHLRCLNCGYILKGLTEPRCPECGHPI